MRDLPRARRQDVEELDGRGLVGRSPGSSTATRIRRSPVTGRTSSRCARRGDLRGAARGRRRHPLDDARDTRRRSRGARARSSSRHRGAMRAHGTTTFEGKSGYGLDRDTELAQLARGRSRGRQSDLARRARRPARAPRRRRVPRLPARRRCCPDAARSQTPPTSSSSAGPSTPSRRAATSTPAATPGSSLRLHGDQFTRDRGGRARGRARRAVGRPPGGDRRGRGRARSRQATSSACCSPSRRSTWPPDAPRPRPRRRGSGDRARDGLQPGERLLREPAARLHARVHPAAARTGGGARRPAPSTRRTSSDAPDRGRLAPGYAPTSSSSTRPTGAISPTTSPATSCTRWSSAGSVVARAGMIGRMANQKQRRRRAKEKRHEYDLVEIDEEGNETVLSASEVKSETPDEAARRSLRRARRKPSSGARRAAAARRGHGC